jgi:ornithine cyclodeaminase/alanine dehydrogenase-like protein (mu-crystallin family)
MTGTAPSLLYLADRDIARLDLQPEQARAAIEDALGFAPGDVLVAPKLTLPIRAGDFFQAMPAASRALGLALVKWIGVMAHPGPGLPKVSALIALSDLAGGYPVAVLAANRITALRTAAMTAIAALRLARADSGAIAFVGTGVQAQSHLAALRPLFPRLGRALLSGRSPASIASFAAAVRAAGLDCSVVDEPRRAIEPADIVVTSVPASEGFAPFLDGGWLKPGAFAAMVDLGRSWRPDTIRDLDVMTTDDRTQSKILAADGKLAHRGPWPADLADLVAGRHPGRTAPGQRTGFVFAGMALADLAVAALAYRRAAAAKNVGARLEA